jgi:probable HAF family extracellular repeat protein
MKNRSLLLCSVLLGALAACSEPVTSPPDHGRVASEPSLTIRQSGVQILDLGTMGGISSAAYAINDSGLIVGSSVVLCPDPCPFDDAPTHAFVWQNGVFTDLGTLGGESSNANAINGVGAIVGSADPAGTETDVATLWQNGQVTNLGTFGGPGSVAYGINANGVIVGTADQPEGQFIRFTGFQWQNGNMTSLGVLSGGDWSVAQGINAAGVIVGQGTNSFGAIRALVWRNGKIRDLGNLAGGSPTAFAVANAINDANQIVGYSDFERAGGIQHAFIWEKGKMTDLGIAPGVPPGSATQAYGINNAGQVVGSMTAPGFFAHGVLWNQGTAIDLGVLPKGNVSIAYGINSTAQIVGTANTTGTTSKHHDHAARWIFTP